MAGKTVSRKDFLITSCKGACALLASAGAASWLAGCAVTRQSRYTAALEGKKVIVPLALFSEKNTQVVQVPGWEYNLLVVKKDAQTYHALLMKCTHQFFKLTAGKNGLHCNLHGSAFDLDGNVVNGPAAKPLTTFPVTLQNDRIIIG